MKIRRLKTLRICIAMIFFVPTAFLFLDIWEIGAKTFSDHLLFFQFVPSALKFLNQPAVGAAGFIVVLITAFVFGRVYCSAICPLGIFQDLISRFFFKQRKEPG